MKVFERLEAFVLHSPNWRFVSVVVGISWLKTGIWTMPVLMVTQPMAANPFANPFGDPLRHYLFWNWLGPFIAWASSAGGPVAYAILHLLFAFAFTGLFFAIAINRFSRVQARASIILFSAIPVSGTIYFWLGMDALTVLLMLIALAWPAQKWLNAILGVALGMQHFEQSLVAFGALALMALLARYDTDSSQYSISFCIRLMLGIVAGKMILIGVFALNDIVVNSGRAHWVAVFLPRLLSQFVLHTQYIVWSVFGVGWLALIHQLEQGRKAVPFCIALLTIMCLLPFVEDQTRVIAIVSFPIVVASWLFNSSFLASISSLQCSVFFLLWIVSPWAWVWRGIPRWSEAPYEVVLLLQNLFGLLKGMPIDSMLGPL